MHLKVLTAQGNDLEEIQTPIGVCRSKICLVCYSDDLSNVLIGRELTQHEVGDIGAGNHSGNNETAEFRAMLVRPFLIAVCQLAGPDDGPVKSTPRNNLLLSLLVAKIEEGHKRDYKERVVQPEPPSAIRNAKSLLNHRSPDVVLLHAPDDVPSSFRENHSGIKPSIMS